MQADLISPMVLAKELQIAPAMLYTRIRNGTLRNHAPSGGQALIDRREALLALGRQLDQQIRKLESTQDDGTPSPLQLHTAITYSKRNAKGPQIAITLSSDEYLTRLRSVDGYELVYRNTSLLDLIGDGTIVIQSPLNLLKMSLAALAHHRDTSTTTLSQLSTIIDELEKEALHATTHD